MKHLLPTALAAIALAGPSLAAEDPILARLAGDWVGRGTYRQSATAAPERIYCRISNTLVQGGAALDQKGRCSVASNSGSIDGLISAEGGGRYAGTLESLASDGPTKLAGTGAGSRLVLDTTFIDARSREPAIAVTTMELTAAGYRLLSERKDPKTGATWTGSDIVFTAQ